MCRIWRTMVYSHVRLFVYVCLYARLVFLVYWANSITDKTESRRAVKKQCQLGGWQAVSPNA